MLDQFTIDLVHAVPDAFKHRKILSKNRQQVRNRMPAAPQLVFVISIRFETGDADQIALCEMRQTRQIEGAHRKPEFALFEQFAREPRPAVLRQLVRPDTVVSDVRRASSLLGSPAGGDAYSTPDAENTDTERPKSG